MACETGSDAEVNLENSGSTYLTRLWCQSQLHSDFYRVLKLPSALFLRGKGPKTDLTDGKLELPSCQHLLQLLCLVSQ